LPRRTDRHGGTRRVVSGPPGPPFIEFGDDLTMLGGGERIEEDDRHREKSQTGRDPAGSQANPQLGFGRLANGLGDIAEGADDRAADEAAKALAALAHEGQDRVTTALR